MSAQVRAYALRRLAAAGDERAARDRHVAWSLHTLDGVAVDTDGQPRTVSLTELAPYVAEWRAALRWAATRGSVRAGLRLARALDPWWREHGGAREGRDLLSRLYQRLDGAGVARPSWRAPIWCTPGSPTTGRSAPLPGPGRGRARRRADQPALLVRALAGHRVTLLGERAGTTRPNSCAAR